MTCNNIGSINFYLLCKILWELIGIIKIGFGVRAESWYSEADVPNCSCTGLNCNCY